MVFIEAPEDEIIEKNSAVATLIRNISTHDGSNDNILDYSNCFSIKLPVEVTANGSKLDISSKDDYKIVEYIFDDSDDDTDVLDITYPISLTLEDFTEVTIASADELSNYSKTCKGENIKDSDIECLDFQYPINGSLFNTSSGTISTFSINSDEEFLKFIDGLNNVEIVSVEFPITVMLFNDDIVAINNFTELESIITTHGNACDEDDDYNYNDDDCDDCNTEDLIPLLTNCTGWTVDKLKRDGNNLDTLYEGYTFNFYPNGNLGVYWNGRNTQGTWVANGEGNNLIVTIDVPDLPPCNNEWRLHEVAEYNATRLDLRVGDNDRLRYNNNCN